MIFDTLANADRYAALHPLFPRAFEFLRATDLKALAPGRYPIEGETLLAIVEAAGLRPAAGPGAVPAPQSAATVRRWDFFWLPAGLDTAGQTE